MNIDELIAQLVLLIAKHGDKPISEFVIKND